MAHPRLYWGEVGNDLTPALIELPISRNHRHGGWDAVTPFFDSAAGPVSASRTLQITRHTCEEGWTAIGQWTGVPLSAVLDAAGILPTARFVMFYWYDHWADSIDLLDALHPQTILAYGMNGRDLPVPHGAPVRLRVERQMGYKSMKYLQRIAVVEEFDDGGEAGNIQNGWAWYTGI